MDFLLHPWQLYVVILAGWINRQQQEVIEYLRTEIGSSGMVAVVVVSIPGRIAVALTAIVIAAVGAVGGPDVVLHDVPYAPAAEIEQAHAVARTHVVEHLVIPSGQDDSAGAVSQADVLDDPLPLRVIGGFYPSRGTRAIMVPSCLA